DELQFVADNNQYEKAGQIIEKAVTNVKRNKALELSVGNYAKYSEWSQSLKDDPKGWTDEEISNIIGFSLDNYGGVRIDENGQAIGNFYGYNPGEKINILTEFDEALKGFASDKGFEVSEIYNLLQDGTRKGFSTTTNETISREEIIAYLKQYSNNDPKINKFYETKSIIDSRKNGARLSNEFLNNVNRLDLFSAYGPKYQRFLKDNGITADNQQIDAIDFVEWFLQDESGIDYDIKGLMEIASSEDENSQLAKSKLAQINNVLNKNFDFEAAAIKSGFSKQEIKHTQFADQMTIFRLQRLEETNPYLYDFPGSSVDYNSKYADKGGFKLLSNEIDNLEGQLEVKQTQIEDNLKAASVDKSYDPDTDTWNNPNSVYKVDNDRLNREKNVMQSELAMKDRFYDGANKHADDKIANNPNIPTSEQLDESSINLQDYYRSKIEEIRTKLGFNVFSDPDIPFVSIPEEPGLLKGRSLRKNLEKYERELAYLSNEGYNEYKKRYDLLKLSYYYTFDREAIDFMKDVGARDKGTKQYRQEYLT
ncbi:hypothetical protein LCGC14_2398730, partial [marine sediment metagenome]